MRATEYPNDTKALIKLGPRRQEFEAWMDVLDAEHVKRGSPYGEKSVWDITGPKCWIEFFTDGWEPAEALDEDLSNCAVSVSQRTGDLQMVGTALDFGNGVLGFERCQDPATGKPFLRAVIHSKSNRRHD
jgi:hypothetical protein